MKSISFFYQNFQVNWKLEKNNTWNVFNLIWLDTANQWLEVTPQFLWLASYSTRPSHESTLTRLETILDDSDSKGSVANSWASASQFWNLAFYSQSNCSAKRTITNLCDVLRRRLCLQQPAPACGLTHGCVHSSRHGRALMGLAPQTKLQAARSCNVKHYKSVEFWSIFGMSSPPAQTQSIENFLAAVLVPPQCFQIARVANLHFALIL